MLKIEIKPLPEGVCPECRGTGIVTPKDGMKQLVEAGRFCDKCEEGSRRWVEVLGTLQSWKVES